MFFEELINVRVRMEEKTYRLTNNINSVYVHLSFKISLVFFTPPSEKSVREKSRKNLTSHDRFCSEQRSRQNIVKNNNTFFARLCLKLAFYRVREYERIKKREILTIRFYSVRVC